MNFNKEFRDIEAENVYFMLQYVSPTQYDLYIFDGTMLDRPKGTNIRVYRQELIKTDAGWKAGDSFVGYSQIATFKPPKGSSFTALYVVNNAVVWTESVQIPN